MNAIYTYILIMIIFCNQGTIINSDSDYFVSDGTPVSLHSPEFIIANFPYDALTETAVFKGNSLTKTNGIYTVDYLGERAIAVKPRRIYNDFVLLAQLTEYDLTVTVYGDYTLKITAEFMQSAKIFTLPFYSQQASVSTHYLNGARVILIHFKDVNKLALYLYASDDVTPLEVINCDDFTFTDSLVVTKNHPTMLGHKTLTTYKIIGNSLEVSDKKAYRKNSDIFAIKEELLGIAFLEEVYLGADFSDFLCDNLKL